MGRIIWCLSETLLLLYCLATDPLFTHWHLFILSILYILLNFQRYDCPRLSMSPENF